MYPLEQTALLQNTEPAHELVTQSYKNQNKRIPATIYVFSVPASNQCHGMMRMKPRLEINRW
jgi:hypothetical protein